MRVAVVGCGAIGTHLGVKMALAGAEVSALARGHTLQAIQANGLTLRNEEGANWHARVNASDDSCALGTQDAVIVCVKTTALVEIAAALPPLLRPDTEVVFMLNGLPWWYLEQLRPGAHDWSAPIQQMVGALREVVSPQQALGGVANSANHLLEPGVVWNSNPKAGFLFGEPTGGSSERTQSLANLVAHHGGMGRSSESIIDDIWRKLYSNLVTHPLGSLTGAVSNDLMTDPELSMVVQAIGDEMATLANLCGCSIARDAYQLNTGVAGHKCSMLQDFEQGRKPEVESLFTALTDLARMHSVAVPTLSLLRTLVRKKAQVLGLLA